MLHVGRNFFTLVSGFVFLSLGLLHGLRAFYGWEIVFNGWAVPLWVSWLAMLVGFLMSLAAAQHLK